jgi:hypothetical protein
MIFDLFYNQFEQVVEMISFVKAQSRGFVETDYGVAPLGSFDISKGSPSGLFY